MNIKHAIIIAVSRMRSKRRNLGRLVQETRQASADLEETTRWARQWVRDEWEYIEQHKGDMNV